LYREMMGDADKATQLAMLWVLSLADGRHSLLDIAERSGIAFPLIRDTVGVLANCEILKAVESQPVCRPAATSQEQAPEPESAA
jgi:aminopeptidase-like protein